MKVCGIEIDFDKSDGFYINDDCMKGMKEIPDKYFDLAIVDPIYGDVTQGGYMKNTDSTTKLAKPKLYHLGIWNQQKTGAEYFKELLRVSKNQIVWGGGTTLQIHYPNHNAGLYGTRKGQVDLPILKWRGLPLIEHHGYLGLCGMVCCRGI